MKTTAFIILLSFIQPAKSVFAQDSILTFTNDNMMQSNKITLNYTDDYIYLDSIILRVQSHDGKVHEVAEYNFSKAQFRLSDSTFEFAGEVHCIAPQFFSWNTFTIYNGKLADIDKLIVASRKKYRFENSFEFAFKYLEGFNMFFSFALDGADNRNELPRLIEFDLSSLFSSGRNRE